MATQAVEPVDVVEGQRKIEPNEDSIALAIVDLHRDTIRYCGGAGWRAWDGTKWSTDHKGHSVWRHVREIGRALPDDKGWSTFRKRMLSEAGVKAVTNLAASDTRITCTINDFDARPYELNTPNGIVNLRTGQLEPHDRTHMHSKITTVAPDFDMPTPLWARFLADTFAGDGELVEYMQRMLGVSMVGEVLEQVLPLAHGASQNGKSTMLATISHILNIGPDGYADSIPAEFLLANYKPGHPNEIARFDGVRFIVTSEMRKGAEFDEAKVKLLTGGDDLTGRFMGGEWYTFKPTHTIWLLANDLPEVTAGGPAIWRRIRVAPFLHTVPKEKRDPNLERKMVAQEGPGILAWLIRGAAEYFEKGLSEPASVRLSTADYERDQDTVARFVAEMCETAPAGTQTFSIRVQDLRAAYTSWCQDEGVTPVSAKRMTQDMIRHAQCETRRTMSARYYDGVRLRVDSQTGSSINGFESLL